MKSRRLLLVGLLATGRSLASPVPGGTLHVESAEPARGCPSEQALAQAVIAYGSAPVTQAQTPIDVVVRFEGDATSLRAVVRATGAKTGERLLRTEGLDCAKLAEATGVVVAVLLDLVPPDTARSVSAFDEPLAEPPAPPPSTPTPRPELPPTPEPKAPAKPSKPRPARLEALLRGEASLNVGALGGALTPALGGLLTLRRGRWEAGLGGTWFAERRVPFAQVAGASVNVSLAVALAEGCFALVASKRTTWDGWLCARVDAGRLSGAGNGFDHDQTRHALWLGAGPTLALRIPVTRVTSLRISVGGLVTLGTHRFDVEGHGSAFESPPLSGSVTFGPELSIL